MNVNTKSYAFYRMTIFSINLQCNLLLNIFDAFHVHLGFPLLWTFNALSITPVRLSVCRTMAVHWWLASRPVQCERVMNGTLMFV